MKNCESLKPARNNTFEGGNRSFEISKNTLAKTVILNSKTLPSYTKIDTILYLPYLKPLRHKLQKLHLVDRGYEEKFAAFTLAETLITLTILGVVAAITVPMLINRQMEAANRTKLKKAMAAYEKALNQMIIDNDIKGAITAAEGFGIGECDMSSSYFKPVDVITANKCRFKTADKVGWDITDIEHPIIFLNDDYKNTALDTASTGLKALAKDADNKDVFGMVGYIDNNGVLRVNDKGVATDDNATILNKTYAFMNNEAVGNSTIDPSRPCSDSTKNSEGKYLSCTLSADDYDLDVYSDITDAYCKNVIYDEKGRIKLGSDCGDPSMITFKYLDNSDENFIVTGYYGKNGSFYEEPDPSKDFYLNHEENCVCNYVYSITNKDGDTRDDMSCSQ